MESLTKTQRIISWICRLTAAVILLQTLFFKFTGAPESVYIFTKVGMEPWGRCGSGVAELIASVLLMINSRAWAGALLALGVMGGAALVRRLFLCQTKHEFFRSGTHGLS